MNKELVKKESCELDVNVNKIGLDDFDDVRIPLGYIKCIQKMSQEAEIEGNNIGDFINTSNGENLGDFVDIIVVKKSSDWAFFPDDESPVLWSEDGKFWSNGDPLTDEQKWKNKRARYYVILKDSPEEVPGILIFKGASRKAGDFIANTAKRLMVLDKTGKETIFSRSYRITSKKESNGKHTYQVMTACLNSGFVDDSVQKIALNARSVSLLHSSSYDANSENIDESEIDLD